jgi:hypothetical protein
MSESRLTIDTFSTAFFEAAWGDSRTDRVEIPASTGKLHLFLQYTKDILEISINYMTQAEKDQLESILRATGAGAYHTMTYATPDGDYIYDGVTASCPTLAYARVRSKMSITGRFEHLVGSANEWQATLTATET